MSSTLRTRIVTGFAAQGFGQMIGLIIQIISVPLFIHYWGKTLYGEWLLLSTVTTYFALSDLGFANAAGNEMTMRVARGDRKGALVVFQSAWILVTGLTLALTVLLLVGAQVLPLSQWLKLVTLSHHEVATVVTILVAQLFFDLQTSLIGIAYRCDGHFAAGTMIRNTVRLCEFLAGVLAVIFGAHLIGVALAAVMTRAVGNLLTILDVRRRSPWLTIGWQCANRATMKEMASPAISFMGFPIGNALSLQGMVTVVGIVLGPVAVVVFSTSRTLSRFVWQIMTGVTNTVWVEMSSAFGAGDIPLARRLHRRACQAAIWISVPMCLMLLVAGPFIFHVWTHGKVPFDHVLFVLLLVVVICNSFWSSSYITLIAVNRHQMLALVYTIANGLSLLFAIVLTRSIGLHGAALSLLVIDIFMSSYVVARSLALVQDTLPAFVRFILTPPFLKPPSGPSNGPLSEALSEAL